jgi:hypothetical protein
VISPFDPLRTLRVLADHEVRFVMIGGLAGRLWGSPTVTNDLDVCYAAEPDDLVALAAALRALDARLRGVDEDVPFVVDAESLASSDSFTFITDAGNLDLLAVPAGTDGFDDLVRTASEMDLGGVTVAVADLEDLIRMKRAAGRPKDLIEVEVLGAVLEERDR